MIDSEESSTTSSKASKEVYEDHSTTDDEKDAQAFDFKSSKAKGLDLLSNSSLHHEYQQDLELLKSKLETLTTDEAIDILKKAIIEHEEDTNFPIEVMEKIKKLIRGPDFYGNSYEKYEYDLKAEACLIGYFSPYPEVRSVTDPIDDEDVPVETFRVYFLAVIWTIIGSGIFQFFSTRQPSIYLSSTVIQLFLYPCGKFLEMVLPDWGFMIKGTRYTLNPGPWNFKEQMAATIMINVAVGGAYVALYNIIVQRLEIFYGNKWATLGYQFLLIISSQFFGFGFAGVLRRWVIYPVKAVWPSVLPSIALSRALLKEQKRENINGWTISQYWFFIVVCSASFVYFWFPNYLFQALSTFNWMTWIAPNNFLLAMVTGSNFGLGVNPWTTFDWNIARKFSPLVTPFYSLANQFIGNFISAFFILGMYLTNYKWTAYLPLNTNALKTNRNENYQVSKILTDGVLDEKKYQSYSPPFYSAGDLVLYGSSFAFYPLSMLWILLNEWRSIFGSFRDFYNDLRHSKRSPYAKFNDPYSRMMSKYDEVPDWWFLAILAVSFVLSVVCITQYPTGTPIWGLIVIILLNAAFLIPITLIHAVTGFGFGLNILCELVAGYAFPGNGSALMILKAYGFNIDGQADSYISDQKIAHYSKIPPRVVFRGQMLTTLVQCIVSIAVVNWQIDNVSDLCHMNQKQRFTCPGARTYYSASITWGVIGPKRMFNGLYPILQWCFLIGAAVALPFWFARKRWPKYFRLINPALIVGGMWNWAPYNLSYMTPGFYLSFIFMYYIKSRYLAWWEKYNYVLSSAMDAGVAFCAVVIFFTVQYTGRHLNWWGNDVPYTGIDGGNGRQNLLDLPEKGYFGPDPGQYP
ncbi:OPT oligopeptide transporter protein-domain-containing protein [Dipodascopsis uninucleata]